MLMPAGLLILFLLAALAVDSSRAFQAKRQLVDLADSAANDAVAAAIVTDGQFTVDGVVRVDPELARAVVTRAVALRGSADLGAVEVVSVRVEHRAGAVPVVEVVLQSRVDSLFAPAVPGGADSVTVTATGRAAAAVAL
jgi:Flp pilus assembly protein TadG